MCSRESSPLRSNSTLERAPPYLVSAVSSAIASRLAALTPREREVLGHIVAGRLNKQIAGHLGTVEKTIKVHRARLMRKLGVRSLAALVRLAAVSPYPIANIDAPWPSIETRQSETSALYGVAVESGKASTAEEGREVPTPP